MRCPDFYKKWKEARNFCEKDPRTAERIDAYLGEIQRLDEISANCSDEEDFVPFGDYEVSEGALRFLIYEKDQKIHDEAAKRLVKLAKRKYDKCGKSVVTGPEIQSIIARVKDEIEATKQVPLFVDLDTYGLKTIAKEPMILRGRYQSDIEGALQYRRSPEFIVSQSNPGLKMACIMLSREFSSKISN
jgi:hypothetical protein